MVPQPDSYNAPLFAECDAAMLHPLLFVICQPVADPLCSSQCRQSIDYAMLIHPAVCVLTAPMPVSPAFSDIYLLLFPYLKAMISLACCQSVLCVLHSHLDVNGFLLHLANGTASLRRVAFHLLVSSKMQILINFKCKQCKSGGGS